MRLVIVKYNRERDLDGLIHYLSVGWEVSFASVVKDEIHYILKKE